MKNSYLFLSMLLFAACGSNEQKTEDTKDTTAYQADTLVNKTNDAANLDTTDVSFFQNAAYGGMVEVEASNKALTFTEHPGIKTFADMMVKDHSGANQKLKSLAEKKGYVLPAALPLSKVELIDKMNSLKDEGRNEYYLQLMVNEHQKAIDIFALASRSKDAEINQFATSLLPTLKHHYMEVKKLDSTYRLPKVNQGDDPIKISDRTKKP